MKILVVDDSEVNLFVIGNWLRKSGYDVSTAVNGLEALKRAESEAIDMIVTDVLMPKMDGFELCRHIKTDPRTMHIPLVFYSADYITPEDEQFALKLGASKYIVKSEDAVAFVRELENVLRQSEQQVSRVMAVLPAEELYWREYADRLIHKLEEKVLMLQQANDQLVESNLRLQKSEERYRLLYEDNPLIHITVAPEGAILSANRFGLQQLGYSMEELLGQPLLKVVHEGDRQAFLHHLRQCLQDSGFISHWEVRQVRKDGSLMWVKEVARAVRDASGHTVVLIVGEDITERKQLEEQLRQAQKMEAVGQLAGGIAHDFNNLLMVIALYCDILQGHLSPEDPLQEYADEIKKAGNRAASLTSQLLAFSRKQIQQLEVLNLNDVVADMDKMLRRLIGEQIDLVTVYGPGLGCVKADRVQVEQIVLNLVLNARDAMNQGGRITVETANVTLDEGYTRRFLDLHPGPYVMLAISDTGCGMDDETRTRIFEPFYTTKEKGKGTGLGLATIYGIVKQSGGHIELQSYPGEGTSFRIYLQQVDDGVSQAGAGEAAAALPRGWETVLLVEDEEMVRQVVRRILETQGYSVLEASRGEEALALVSRHDGPLHLLLTDVVMPEMSGRDLAERLASSHPQLKVLYMSGYTDHTIGHNGTLDPGTAFVAKPFTPDFLMVKLRELLDTGSGGCSHDV